MKDEIKLIREAKFNFRKGEYYYDKNSTPKQTIAFDHSLGIEMLIESNDVAIIEEIAEKLKKEYIVFLKERYKQNTKSDDVSETSSHQLMLKTLKDGQIVGSFDSLNCDSSDGSKTENLYGVGYFTNTTIY